MYTPSQKLSRRNAIGALTLGLLSVRSSLTASNHFNLGSKDQLYYLTISQIAAMIKDKKISSKELTRMILDRIIFFGNGLNSYTTIMESAALAAADRMDKELANGKYRGPLHGVPIGIKDLLYTVNAPTTASHSFNAGFIAPFNATVVDRLEDAGAVIVGKLNLTEGALGGYNSTWPIPQNPWGAGLWTGMSSSGSGVATAGGFCFGSIGTDTGGSVRYPSYANGVVGLKPTYGLVSRHGVMPLSQSLDHVGPITRSTLDAAIMLEAICGPDPNDATTLKVRSNLTGTIRDGVKGLKIGIDRDYTRKGVDANLVTSIEDALKVLESRGAKIATFKMPDNIGERSENWFVICSREAFEANRKTFPSRKSEYGAYFQEVLEIGSKVTDEQYKKALEFKKRFELSYRKLLTEVDAYALPVTGGLPTGITDELWRKNHSEGVLGTFDSILNLHFCATANLAGIPSLALPCGKAENKMPPPGFQIMGDALSEATLCRIGHAYEEETGWGNQHPPI